MVKEQRKLIQINGVNYNTRTDILNSSTIYGFNTKNFTFPHKGPHILLH